MGMSQATGSTQTFKYIEVMCRLTKTTLTAEQYRDMIYWDKDKIDEYFKKTNH